MGQVTSHSRKPFDFEEFSVAWLAFKGEMSEIGSRNRSVASKAGLSSSKLLRSLFGESFVDELTEYAADAVPREHFIVLLAQYYLGNTEDKLGYLFSMYSATCSLDRNQPDGPAISPVDVECLLEYMAPYHPVPEKLVAIFDECHLSKDTSLTLPVFLTWVRQSPSLMTTIAKILPAHVAAKPPPIGLSVCIPDDTAIALSTDPLNMSPSMALHPSRHHQSFDIVGGDSSDEDEDAASESDDHAAAASYSNSDADDELRHIPSSSPAGQCGNAMPQSGGSSPPKTDSNRTPATSSPRPPPMDVRTTTNTTHHQGPSSKPKGKHNAIGKFGRAVGGGIRTMLHPGKPHTQSKHKSGHDVVAAIIASDPTDHHYVGGYLHKVSDGKWAKRNWHVRWFVLDIDRGILAYYKSNPSSIVQSPHGSVAFYDDLDLHHTTNFIHAAADEAASSNPLRHRAPPSTKPHPWYRGCMDLNEPNVSLLFDKQYGHNAPNKFIFQVSSVGMGDEAKRRFQYKLCASTEDEFVQWTSAIAQVINRKHVTAASLAAPPAPPPKDTLQQQLHRQRLMQQQHADHARHDDDASTQPAKSPTKPTQSPPRSPAAGLSPSLSTKQPASLTPSPTCANPSLPCKQPRDAAIPWRLQLVVEGQRQCFLFLALVNVWSFVALNYFGFLVQVPVMALATYYFFRHVHAMPTATRRVQRCASGASTRPAADGALPCAISGACCLHADGPLDDAIFAGDEVAGEDDDGSPATVVAHQPPKSFRFDMLSTCGQSTDDDTDENAWSIATATAFNVRSKEYKKSKKKEPSQAALLDFVGVDVVRTDGKIDCIAEHVHIPATLANTRLFILHAQMPLYAPSLFHSSYDGPGASLIMYWSIPPAIEEALQSPEIPAMQLLQRFLEASTSSGDPTAILDRFKVIAQVVNEHDCGVAGYTKKLLTKNNATPVLTRPQHRIYHTPTYTEVDVDVHIFSLVARTGIHALIDKTASMLIDVAFVLQGESEAELPEQILGVCRLVRIDLAKAKHLNDVARSSDS
ncbi:hypothetical protein H310_13442 [Aphanomyces invadans]|uniref:PH domain-containing protein n=1 Tax=Aphanomyces invadans TaxID=157072 RepID=A0A024TDW9_9STRA|nr:hypothetical protein H310_13442 [Aphanomyces invadans]ETV92209.1 hypothetical protein H310_13442 [Aphanomyces invadans]|eukprot:XP_008879173.1 hypothetical protein H310_13442 [Aphanomyces invadans]